MKTIVGMYDDLTDARQTVHDLVNLGINRDNISLIAGDREGSYASGLDVDTDVDPVDSDNVAGGAATGAVIGGLGGLLLGLGALAIPGIGPVIAAGPIVSALIGAGVGAAVGGLVGALTSVGVPEEQAGYYAEGVRRGSTLVTVEAPEHQLDEVVNVMERHHPIDIEERATTWRDAGWTGYEETEESVPVVDRTAAQPTTSGGSAVYTTPARTSYAETAAVTTAATGTATALAMDAAPSTAFDTSSDRALDTVPVPTANLVPDQSEFNVYDPFFRSHFQNHYIDGTYAYQDYEPAYHYGYTLANDDRYHGQTWEAIEPEARRYWSENYHDSPWENFKDAVRYGWQQVKHAVAA